MSLLFSATEFIQYKQIFSFSTWLIDDDDGFFDLDEDSTVVVPRGRILYSFDEPSPLAACQALKTEVNGNSSVLVRR